MCCVAPLMPHGDVKVGRDLRAGLTDLVCVRPPAGARDDARAADRAAEQLRELLDDREALRRADAAPAADDDLRLGKRHAAARGHGRLEHANGQLVPGQVGHERLDGPRLPKWLRRDDVRGDTEQCGRAVDAGLLEQASTPALPHDRDRVARHRRDAVRGERQVEPRRKVPDDLVAPVAARGDDRPGTYPRRRIGDRCRPGGRRERAGNLRHLRARHGNPRGRLGAPDENGIHLAAE